MFIETEALTFRPVAVSGVFRGERDGTGAQLL